MKQLTVISTIITIIASVVAITTGVMTTFHLNDNTMNPQTKAAVAHLMWSIHLAWSIAVPLILSLLCYWFYRQEKKNEQYEKDLETKSKEIENLKWWIGRIQREFPDRFKTV